MNQIKVWPHLTIVAVLCALLAGLAVAFYFKHEQTVEAEALPNAARIQRVDGEVAISDALNPSLQSSDGNGVDARAVSFATEQHRRRMDSGNTQPAVFSWRSHLHA